MAVRQALLFHRVLTHHTVQNKAVFLLLNLVKESLEKPYSDFVSSVIIVTVTWEVTLSFVINNNTVFVSYCLNLSILDSTERVNNVRETCNTSIMTK